MLELEIPGHNRIILDGMRTVLVCSRNYKESFKSFCISDCRASDCPSFDISLSEDLIIKTHLAQPQATIDDWIEAMSDENARFHRIMLEDNAQSHFDLDIAIQVRTQ